MTGNQKIIVKENAAMLAQKATTLFRQTAKESIDRQGRFVVANLRRQHTQKDVQDAG